MSPLVLASENPTARKEHICDLCGRTIAPGETYNRQRNIGDDGPYVFKVCAHCDALVQIIGSDRLDWDGDGYTTDDICEYEPETIAEARLIVGWKRKWRRRDGTLVEVPV